MTLSKSTQGSVYVLVSFPSGWPLARAGILFQCNQDSTSIAAYAGIDGRICITLVGNGTGEEIERTFQPFHLVTGTRVVVCVVWSGDEVECHVNSVKLLPDIHRRLGSTSIEGNNDIRPPKVLQYPRIQASDAVDERGRFFLETIRDLDAKLCVSDTYNLVRAAALLRQLLLDKLIHEVNSAYHCKLLFEVFVSPPAPITPRLQVSSIDPARHPNRSSATKKLDAFLGLVVATPSLSVRDIIRTCANAKGGVHLGAAKENFEREVLYLDKNMLLGGQEPSLNLLGEIGNVTLRALRPLVDAIRSHGAAVQPSRVPTFDGSRPAYRIAEKIDNG